MSDLPDWLNSPYIEMPFRIEHISTVDPDNRGWCPNCGAPTTNHFGADGDCIVASELCAVCGTVVIVDTVQMQEAS